MSTFGIPINFDFNSEIEVNLQGLVTIIENNAEAQQILSDIARVTGELQSKTAELQTLQSRLSQLTSSGSVTPL